MPLVLLTQCLAGAHDGKWRALRASKPTAQISVTMVLQAGPGAILTVEGRMGPDDKPTTLCSGEAGYSDTAYVATSVPWFPFIRARIENGHGAAVAVLTEERGGCS